MSRGSGNLRKQRKECGLGATPYAIVLSIDAEIGYNQGS
jgi:hypothetical protein